jgi:hypothetical protein
MSLVVRRRSSGSLPTHERVTRCHVPLLVSVCSVVIAVVVIAIGAVIVIVIFTVIVIVFVTVVKKKKIGKSASTITWRPPTQGIQNQYDEVHKHLEAKIQVYCDTMRWRMSTPKPKRNP